MSGTEKAEMKISGMTCVNCVKAIENSLTKLDGVSSAKVNLGTEIGTVEYDASKLNVSDLETAITDAGYNVVNEQAVIKIGGMTCVNCVNAIEKVVGKLNGVGNFPKNSKSFSMPDGF